MSVLKGSAEYPGDLADDSAWAPAQRLKEGRITAEEVSGRGEVAEAGHLDSAGMAFIALALLARMRRQPVLTGVWLGAAVMIKFYPLVLFPALWWRGDGRGSRRGTADCPADRRSNFIVGRCQNLSPCVQNYQ